MTYSLKDVDAAEALVRAERPDTIIERGDYGWSLSIADKGLNSPAVILFQPPMDAIGQHEIKSSPELIRDACVWLGAQWTPEQIAKFNSRGRPRHHINRIQ